MSAPQLDLKNPSVVTVESLNSNASSAYEDFQSDLEQGEYTLRSDREDRKSDTATTAANSQPRMAAIRTPAVLLSELEQLVKERDGLNEKLAKKEEELSTSQAHQAKMWKVLNKQRKMINELRADLHVATSRLDAQVKQTTEEQVEMTTVTPTSLKTSMALKSEELDDCLRELSNVATPVFSTNNNAPAIPPKNRPAPIDTITNSENRKTCVFGPPATDKSLPQSPAHEHDHSVSMTNMSIISAADFRRPAPAVSEVSTVSSPGSQHIDQGLSHSSAHHTPSSSISSTRSQPHVPNPIGTDLALALDQKRVFKLSCSTNKNHTHRHSTEVVVKLGTNDLPRVKVVVNSTLVSAHKRGLDKVVCILTCKDADTGTSLWSIAKDYNSLLLLDREIRPHCGQYYISTLPEKQLFNSSSPQKADQRREMLNTYFDKLMEVPLLPKPTLEALCFFLSSNVVDEQLDGDGNILGVRGYLTKRGKLFGQWKVGYFELDGPFLNYFDKPGGALAGSISLYKSNVGPMSEPEGEESDYRHAFVILESRQKSPTKHILCAESDEERDMWVNTCVSLIEEPAYCEMPVQKTSTNNTTNSSIRRQLRERSSSSIMSLVNGTNKPEKISTDGMSSVTVLEPPSAESAPTSPSASRPLSQLASGLMKRTGSLVDGSDKQRSSPSVNGQLKKLSKMRRSALVEEEDPRHHDSRDDGGIEKALSELGLIDSISSDESPKEDGAKKQLFGASICDACCLSSKETHGHIVPAIIVRCVELLESRNAFYEEGIFRISGSQSAVRTLRTKFNSEYDVDLVELGAEPHAVTTLLKQFLRELQDQIIPSNMAMDFKAALDLDAAERVARLKVLVTQLPECNLDLLAVLCELFDKVLRNSALNKMSLRNLGIVVSPAVNISAPIFIALLSDYSDIFH